MDAAWTDDPHAKGGPVDVRHESCNVVELEGQPILALSSDRNATRELAGDLVLDGCPVHRVVHMTQHIEVSGSHLPRPPGASIGRRRMMQARRHDAASCRRRPRRVEALRKSGWSTAAHIETHPEHCGLDVSPLRAATGRPPVRPAWPDTTAERGVCGALAIPRPLLDDERRPPHHPRQSIVADSCVVDVVGGDVLKMASERVQAQAPRCVGVREAYGPDTLEDSSFVVRRKLRRFDDPTARHCLDVHQSPHVIAADALCGVP